MMLVESFTNTATGFPALCRQSRRQKFQILSLVACRFTCAPLRRLQQENESVTSSHELGRRLDISSAQIRKDLSHFGGFGKQGTGYQIEYLIDKLQDVLQVNQEWMVVVVGARQSGHCHFALSRVPGSRLSHRPSLRHQSAKDRANGSANLSYNPLIPCIRSFAMKASKSPCWRCRRKMRKRWPTQLVEAGVQAILNYAPININVPPDVQIQYIDPGHALAAHDLLSRWVTPAGFSHSAPIQVEPKSSWSAPVCA